MNDDAAYILDMLNMQLYSLEEEMKNDRIRRDKFDKFSYSAWAIQETLDAIHQYGSYHYITVSVIINIMKEQEVAYNKYFNTNPIKQARYGHALWTIDYLLKLTGGFIYE